MGETPCPPGNGARMVSETLGHHRNSGDNQRTKERKENLSLRSETQPGVCENGSVRPINGTTAKSLIGVLSTSVNGLLFVKGSGTGPRPTGSPNPEAGEFHANATALFRYKRAEET